MAKEINIKSGIDWTIIWIYISLVFIGIINIYAAVYNVESPKSIFSLDHNSGRQILFTLISLVLILIILFVDFKVFDSFAYIFYGIWIVLLFVTIFAGANINGSKSWIRLGGGFNLQPAEFAKTFTVLALAKYLSTPNVNLSKTRYYIRAFAISFLPAVLILLQKEAGQAITFGSLFILMYREGLTGIYPSLIIAAVLLVLLALILPSWAGVLVLATLGLIIWYLVLKRYERNRLNFQRMIGVFIIFSAFVLTVDFIVNNVLEKHQANRIKVWVSPDIDPLGTGWNVTQSKLAIGSGGFFGKGYLKGTQTKGDFIPEQSTDFIFCTIGEEWGFLGTFLVVGLYFILFIRIINLAEKQKSKFARIYGYGVVSFMFFNLLANVGMTIGLMPVIGIPLPFVSSGGSSLMSFTVLLFIFLKLDAHRSYKV
jgi:rod shape determining protein RodA